MEQMRGMVVRLAGEATDYQRALANVIRDPGISPETFDEVRETLRRWGAWTGP